ncbi:phage tail tube protein [Saccharopolyspora sp. 6V]|uniref:phage tail tube protein n=1 Tax=Saccharopolyspora sp. 6V TaxID=2877239 RepID=UPI001CD1CD23|nr:phage tail tube protein [Saccharopolyspora sp. 6V]MCA1195134.1 phage tail protein [Saccharopolyspora sp. 6V]
MALRSMLAKDWTLEVQDPAASDPDAWITVRGLTSFEESSDDNTEDDGDFDSGGWGSSVVTQRTWSIEAEGKRKRDDAATEYTPDPGQEVIRKASRLVGFDAAITVRWYRRDGSPDAYQGTATVSDYTKGGEVTDLEPFSFTLNGQGEPVEIANPGTTPPVDGGA